MKCLTEYLKFHTRSHRAYVHITPQVEQIVGKSGVNPTFAVRSCFWLAAEPKSCNCNSRFRKSL